MSSLLANELHSLVGVVSKVALLFLTFPYTLFTISVNYLVNMITMSEFEFASLIVSKLAQF